ncbi:MAG: ABC transporter permease subunit [Proteobacteria bacterium]|nr:ABC transporter permease subunit [Pseudomonadota bacterium]
MATFRIFGRPWRNFPPAVAAADLAAFGLLLGLLALAGLQLASMATHVGPAGLPAVDLDPALLPYYAVRTLSRMGAALTLSVLFTFVYAPAAARDPAAERILIPLLDVLQSVPILGYVSLLVAALAALLPGWVLAYEAAAVFALFTSQAWNMTFSFYQSIKTVPAELTEAATAFGFSRRQRFWNLEVPFAVPGLVWNAMMAVSGGWFFVVAAEAISVGGETVSLPGIGSYIAAAIAAKRVDAVLWAIGTMAVLIASVDFLMFRPLVAWSERFRLEVEPGEKPPRSIVLQMFRRARVGRVLARGVWKHLAPVRRPTVPLPAHATIRPAFSWTVFVWIGGFAGAAFGIAFVVTKLSFAEIPEVLVAAAMTALRVTVMIVVAAAIWTPVGIAIGLRPNLTRAVQPVAQFFAAFPANLLYPVFVVVLVRWKLDPDLFLSPLVVLGTQWYILFNVIAGAAAMPAELKLAARSLQIGGFLWWRRVGLPAIYPYLITGLVTAVGGAWNATVVSEVVSWGDTKLVATGLGSYIAAATDAGDFPRLVLGIGVMSGIVVLLNRAVWDPLYRLAVRRYRLG